MNSISKVLATIKCRSPGHVKRKSSRKTGNYAEEFKWPRLWEGSQPFTVIFVVHFVHIM